MNDTAARLDLVISQVRMDIALAEGIIQKLKADLDEFPAYVLEWSLSSFDAAARLEVYRTFLHAIEKGRPIEEIKEHVKSEVSRRARNPVQSTSATATLISTYRFKAWADLAELLDGF